MPTMETLYSKKGHSGCSRVEGSDEGCYGLEGCVGAHLRLCIGAGYMMSFNMALHFQLRLCTLSFDVTPKPVAKPSSCWAREGWDG